MAQFEVYKNPSNKTHKTYPFLVDVQSAVIDQIATRLVVPLTPMLMKQSMLMAKLTPEIDFNDTTYLFLTQQLTSVPEEILRTPIGTLKNSRSLLLDAIDFAITGI